MNLVDVQVALRDPEARPFLVKAMTAMIFAGGSNGLTPDEIWSVLPHDERVKCFNRFDAFVLAFSIFVGDVAPKPRRAPR